MGRDEDALRYLTQAVKPGAENAQAYAYLSDLYRSRGDRQSAAQTLLQSTRLNRELPIAHHFLGLLHLDLGLFPQAIQSFDLALSLRYTLMN